MNRRICYVFLFVGIVWASTSCKEDKKVIKPFKIEFKKEGELSLFRSTSDSVITTFDIEIADNDYEIQRGLMDRHSMKDDQAMLFVFPDMKLRSFYMKNTLIPLDIVYIDKDHFVVSIQENAIPLDETSLPSNVPAQYVLEINGGLSERMLLKMGDSIAYKRLQ